MREHSSSADNYVLWDTPWAIQRLLRLDQIYRPFTRSMLIEAGLTTGMRVLDIGCGPGAVSLIAAELVGEAGEVLGIDASGDMLAVAQSRMQSAGRARGAHGRCRSGAARACGERPYGHASHGQTIRDTEKMASRLSHKE